MGRLTSSIVMMVLTLLSVSTSLAETDVDEARSLIQQGTILPLETIVQRLQKDYPGHVIDVELEHEHKHYRYEIEWLDPSGVVWEFKIDASNGHILQRSRD